MPSPPWRICRSGKEKGGSPKLGTDRPDPKNGRTRRPRPAPWFFHAPQPSEVPGPPETAVPELVPEPKAEPERTTTESSDPGL